MTIQNDYNREEIFGNPEYAAYYSLESETFKNYLYRKYSIAIDSQDPIAAEYEILNQFYGKISILKDSMETAVGQLETSIDTIDQTITAYYKDTQKINAENNKMLKEQFSVAANSVANQLNKKIDTIKEYKPSLPRSSMYLLSSVALLSIINTLVLAILFLK